MKRSTLSLFALSLLGGYSLSISSSVYADTIIMTNGDTLRGQVVQIDQGQLTLNTTYAGNITIDMRYLKALETDKFLWVRLKGQSAFKLIRFSSKQGKVWMDDRQGNEMPLEDKRSLADITSTKPETGWVITGNAQLSFNADDSSGNKKSYGTKGQVTVKNPANTNDFSWNTYYESNNEKLTSRKWNTKYNYKRYLDTSVYLQGNASWNYALNQTPQTIASLGPGIGYQFWDTPESSLQADLGISRLWETYKNGTKTTEWASRWDMEYTKTFLQVLACYQNINVLKPLNNGMILSTESGCKMQITDNFFVNAEYDYNYTTQKDPSVTVGSQRLSHIINFGLGVNW